ncbi:ABC transporter permease [Paenibacillus koleovorans]|uniref:ABC transporter permease n=1 Tax=Paenibacillus koleovorans TaxID=121608 RepID=UPI000FDBC00B|nr:ABC transporter permease subunit [Paenibacillus koleovorans]
MDSERNQAASPPAPPSMRTSTGKPAGKPRFLQLLKNKELLILALPAIIYKLIFAYIPMYGVIIAFKEFRYDKGIWGSEWVGFDNFEFLFKTEYAWRITRNTILYNLSYLILTTICALAIAVLMNELSRRSVKFHQTTMFLPHFLSWILVGYVAYAFLEHSHGFANVMLIKAGLPPISWYKETYVWPYILNIVHLWKGVGFSALLYYAAIIGVNPEYYDAAKIDGASRFQIATKVTIPMIAPLISILLILSLGGIIHGDFGLHYFVPNQQVSTFTYPTTDVIDTFVLRAIGGLGNFGMASAVGFYQSFVGLVLIVIVNLIVRKLDEEKSLF